MANLTEFFTQLNTDAKLLDAYKKDPEATMKAHGLSDKEIKAVLSGDAKVVSSLVGDAEMKAFLLIVNPSE
ncbi:hypothetical protein L2735_12350 [Shewanella olleyana]|uniref:hypothetical protein n=1 Tax=Shewanella olleyana TaxID=135626 RepID=UPI00200FDA3D|nr:hypothetical protein [Shewanella olleyana]MCL1067589.1 hypothetical protein [Shewanella olleyana]